MPAPSPVLSDCTGGAVPGADCPVPLAAGDDGAAVLFPQAQPLVLDLGCGNGAFLSGLAAACPGWNILGVEKKDYRVRQARRRASDLPNAGIVRGEAMEVLRSLPGRSVARAYLLFSDPWPKRRHAVRRLVQPEFIALLGSCFEPGGVFFFASDSRDYARWAEALFRSARWRVAPWDVSADWPRTEFEQRFLSAGFNIGRFQAAR